MAEVTHDLDLTSAFADQQQEHGIWRTPSVIAAADVSGVEGSNQ